MATNNSSISRKRRNSKKSVQLYSTGGFSDEVFNLLVLFMSHKL